MDVLPMGYFDGFNMPMRTSHPTHGTMATDGVVDGKPFNFDVHPSQKSSAMDELPRISQQEAEGNFHRDTSFVNKSGKKMTVASVGANDPKTGETRFGKEIIPADEY